MQQSNISAIFAKVELFNFGQITNHLLLPYPAFQPLFCTDNNAIWRSSQNLMCKCWICPIWKILLLIFCSAQIKQALDQLLPRRRRIQWISCWAKLLPGNAALARQHKLALRQIGAQRLAGDVSTGNFYPIVPLKFRKTIFDSPPVVLFHLGLCGVVFPATSPPGPAGAWPASGARSIATHAWQGYIFEFYVQFCVFFIPYKSIVWKICLKPFYSDWPKRSGASARGHWTEIFFCHFLNFCNVYNTSPPDFHLKC